MAINKIKIKNFKIFEDFELDLNKGLNVIVGDNEVGKSTILEAIHLALTGMINGKYLSTELTQYLFNSNAVEKYVASIGTDNATSPPTIHIEIYFSEDDDFAIFMGGINSDKNNTAYGIRLSIGAEITEEYNELVKTGNIKTLPIEYYEPKWWSFAEKQITTKSIPIKSAMIDSSLAKYQNGSDIYISRIIRQGLDPAETAKVAQSHRKMLEMFKADESIIEINKKVSESANISNREITLSVELLSKNAWESSLITCVDKVPFHYIGKGEQCVIKTKLALADKRAKNASVILLEEPENHLTHARLNELIDDVSFKCSDRQVIMTTHSSFVANKLGLDSIILLSEGVNKTSFSDLSEEAAKFFKKLSGYDTLRLVLSKSTILVEGASDELVVQKAYTQANEGRLPIFDGVDVISVGTSFLRFLEIANLLNKRVAVITDNDGKINALINKYSEYLGDNKKDCILISYDSTIHTSSDSPIENYNYNTLENLMLIHNGLATMNTILKKSCQTEDKLRIHMKSNKTECALAIFEYEGEVKFPQYITEAVCHVNK